MLALLLAVAVGQTGQAQYESPVLIRPRVSRSDGPSRTSRCGADDVCVETSMVDAGWKANTSMGIERLMGQAVVLQDGRVLVEGGLKQAGGVATTTEIYDPADGGWATTGARTYLVRGGADVVLADGRVLACGGYADGTATTETHCELWQSDGGWVTTGSMSVGRYQFQTLLLDDGRVLALGDTNQAAALAGTEVWNPDSGVWTDAGTMNYARRWPTATKLADGRVYVHGGADNAYVGLPNAEIWSPDSGTWTNVASSGLARTASKSVLLDDGRVLIVGGSEKLGTDNPPVYRDALLYTPGTDSYEIADAGAGATSILRMSPFVAKLANGEVLFAGGEYHPSGTTEVAQSGGIRWTGSSWVTDYSLNTARLLTAASSLPGLGPVVGGKPFAIGGGGPTGSTRFATTEQYQPYGSTFCSARAYATFEAFPQSGAGAGETCPLPNWVTASETFNSGWTASNGGAAPVVTANQATSPTDGLTTADAVTFTQSPGGLLESVLYQPTSAAFSGTFSVYVRGNGQSGTISLGSFGAVWATTACSYTADSWTRCTHVGTDMTRVLVGCETQGGATNHCTASPSVYLVGAMLNAGSTAAPYVKTTTVAATSMPTGARGEALTFSRTGNAYCAKQGLATTGITSSDLVLMPGNAPRVELDAYGTKGLRVESQRTNSLVQSQDFTTTWTKYNFGSGSLPVVTANHATAPDGTLTADRVQFSAVNAGDQSALLQASGITTGSNTVSVYVKGTSGSGTICVQAYISGGAYTECAYNSTTWTRCVHTGTVTSSGQMRIGNDSATCGGGARSAQDVLLWGAQWEAGAYATSYIPTTTAAAVRNAERAFFAATFPAGAQSLASTRTGPNTTAAGASVWALTGNTAATGYGLGQYRSGAAFYGLITGATPVISFTATPTGVDRVWMSANGTTIAGSFAGTANSGASATTPASVTALCVGVDCTNGVATGQADGIISRVCLDPDPTRCR